MAKLSVQSRLNTIVPGALGPHPIVDFLRHYKLVIDPATNCLVGTYMLLAVIIRSRLFCWLMLLHLHRRWHQLFSLLQWSSFLNPSANRCLLSIIYSESCRFGKTCDVLADVPSQFFLPIICSTICQTQCNSALQVAQVLPRMLPPVANQLVLLNSCSYSLLW
jgi:hypothetical protein